MFKILLKVIFPGLVYIYINRTKSSCTYKRKLKMFGRQINSYMEIYLKHIRKCYEINVYAI